MNLALMSRGLRPGPMMSQGRMPKCFAATAMTWSAVTLHVLRKERRQLFALARLRPDARTAKHRLAPQVAVPSPCLARAHARRDRPPLLILVGQRRAEFIGPSRGHSNHFVFSCS